MKILDVAKAALYGIFLNYYCYFVIYGSFIPMGTVLFFGVAFVCVCMDILKRKRMRLGTEIKSWLLYAVFSLVTTAIILLDSSNTDYVSDIIKYVQRLMIIVMVVYICEREKSVKFGLRLMAVTAVALSLSVILTTGDIQLKLDIASGADLSANDTGAIAAFGCFAVVYGWGKRGHTSLLLSLLKTAGVICCIIVIFLTGSRKSIYAVLIMLAMLLVLCFPDYSRRVNFRKLATVTIVAIAAYLYISEALLPYAQMTNLYARLFGRGMESAGASTDGRVELMLSAIEDFLAHPFFGLGYNRFTVYHANYTHSTYLEPLACSGLIGLLYLYPYYLIIRKQLYLLRRTKKGSAGRLKQKELLVYLGMALFVGVGIPFMYKDAPCILLGTLIAAQTLSLDELRKTGEVSGDY